MSDRQNAIRLLAADAHARGLSCFSNSLKIIADGYGKLEAELGALKEENERQRADYEEVLADKRRLTRELDILLNGDSAAKQASLCDLVSQLGKYSGTPILARLAELEAREVDAIANKICGHLPKGYYIKLCLEKEAGWVELDSPDVATDRDDFEGGIYSQLLCALEVAEELSKEPANEG